MKKSGTVILTLVVVVLFSFTVYAPSDTNPDIQVTLVEQSPSPVEPGQVVNLRFQIENDAAASSKDVIVEFKETFPFTIYGDTLSKNIGTLRAGSDVVIVEFQVKVDEDAVEKDTEVVLQVHHGTGSALYDNEEFTVDIQTQDAVLDIVSITTDPQQIPPGGTGEVTFIVKNLADSLLRNVKFNLDFDDDDIPLAPFSSSSEKILDQLKSDFQDAIKFTLIADPEATPGLYKVPLTITYNDERGNTTTITDLLAVKVGDTPKLRVHIKRSTVLEDGAQGKVTLELANAGTTDVKLVELTLLPSEEYQLITPSNYFYIGDIDADDTESEEIHLYIKSGVDMLTLPIKVAYYDANNRPLQQQVELPLQLYSSGDLKRFGLVERSSAFIWILLLLLAGGGYWWYTKKYKPKKKKR